MRQVRATVVRRHELEQIMGIQSTAQLEALADTVVDRPLRLGFGGEIVGIARTSGFDAASDEIWAVFDISEETAANMLDEGKIDVAPALALNFIEKSSGRQFDQITESALVPERGVPQAAAKAIREGRG